ncbi:carboxypeptidase regulatory-like domain-containing protein [Amorphoplanes digitatis]|uniref:Carboxypeptidase regulatory-like domain-containing protein n=1 Tax=Actinoplanes digitatis TaxID=1868 RepID=A0A7W7I643_9ACTN|nr:carboxypeptidase regulatory-like domain-containing protein [Actinoplanes digitatis]MBB4767132.1 hypothetical protein [Actinoplanes digitatis]
MSSLSSGDVPSGGETTLTYKVTNRNAEAGTVTVVVSANGMSCSGQCNFDEPIGPNEAKEYTAKLKAGNVDPGQTKDTRIQVSADIGGESGNAGRNVTLRGPEQAQTVRQVSGKVKDQEGKAVAGALVGLRDSQNHQYDTTTNGDGGYSFTSTDSKPIAVGALAVAATKGGYDVASVNAQGSSGKSINVPLTIKLKAGASPSTSPSATASASAEPTEEVSEDATDPATDDSAAALDQTPTSGEDEGSGSMLFIILGGLLVAAGIGAIVLVLMRRKAGEDADGADGADAPLGGAQPAAAGNRYPGAGETRLAGAPMGGAQATMIAPRSGAPSIGDAPTMIHRAPPVVDEFPDPYGAPMPQGGGYNAPGGWGAAGAAGAAGAVPGAYGAAGQYGGAQVPAQGGYPEQAGYDQAAPYGAPQGGYNEPDGYDQAAPYGAPQGGYEQQPQQRYDEPTGMYRPEPGGYPQEAGYADQGGYGGAEPAYGQNAGYGQGGDDYAGQAPARGGAYPGGGNGYAGGAYGAPAEPADQGGGYGQWDGQGGAVDNGNAYGAPAGGGAYGAPQGGQAYGNPNYGAPAGGGYDQADGYGAEQGGYDPRAAYGRPDGYDPQQGGGRGQQPPGGGYGGPVGQGGYGADQGGYYGAEQQGGGRHGGPPPEATRPGQRRPLDWMDD